MLPVDIEWEVNNPNAVQSESLLPQQPIGLIEKDAKLDILIEDVAALRNDLADAYQVILRRFDANERRIITAVMRGLDQQVQRSVSLIINAIESNRISVEESQEMLDMIRQALTEFRRQSIALSDPDLASSVNQLLDAANDPQLGIKHALKLTVPILPLLVSYEGTIELSGTFKTLKERLQYLLDKSK